MSATENSDQGTHTDDPLPGPARDAATRFIPTANRAKECRQGMDALKGCCAEKNRDGSWDHEGCDPLKYLDDLAEQMITWGISIFDSVPGSKLPFGQYVHQLFTFRDCPYGQEPKGWTGEIKDARSAADYMEWRFRQLGVSEGGVDSTPSPNPPLMYYVRQTGKYAVKATDGDWQEEVEGSVKDRLIRAGVSPIPPKTGSLSDCDLELMNIRDNAPVDCVLSLAGYMRGRHEVNGRIVLVPKTFTLIEPKPYVEGAAKHIMGLLNGLFAQRRRKQWDFTQVDHLAAMLKLSWLALQRGDQSGAPASFMCGPGDAGKTLFIDDVVVPLLGGRRGSAYNYITGLTSFNDELISSEVWVVDDGPPVGDYTVRRRLASLLKQAVASRNVACHAKGKAQLTVPLYRRLFVALNPEEIENLPPLDDSMGDKYMLFKTGKCQMPDDCMPLPNVADRPKFAAQLRAELPYFIDWLLKSEISDDLASRRFGVKCFKHPDLVIRSAEVSDLDTKYAVLCKILFHGLEAEAVELAASEIYTRIMTSHQKEMASQLFRNPRSLGIALGELRASPQHRHLIRSRVLDGRTLWTITQDEVRGLESSGSSEGAVDYENK